jgi:hypothetical protein
MNSNGAGKGGYRVREWLAGMAGMMLLLSVGLEVYAEQTHGQASIATLLLTLYAASWAFVMSLICLAVVSAWWLTDLPARQVVPMHVLRSLTCRSSG